jgi:2-keto-3-deoxy-L-rhamnonate aldolase RhmA
VIEPEGKDMTDTGTDTDLVNPFRAALSQRRPLVGIWSMLNSSNAIEGLGWSGFDWLLIDGEHSPLSLDDALNHLRILAGTPTIPIVRLVWNDKILLKQYLDAGAQTLMLPYVQSASEAAAAVAAMRYPPRGQRGVAGLHRASRYGRVRNYTGRADSGLFLIVQVETREALSHLKEIAAVDGVDAIFFGPADLAASMGMTGHPEDPSVTAEIEAGLEQVRMSKKFAGALAPNAVIAERHIQSRFDFVSVANDCAILFGTADATAARFRALAEHRDPGTAKLTHL